MDRIRLEELNKINRVNAQLFDQLESTNSYLKSQAFQGLEEGCLIVARSQTGGRGRRGRSFYSPTDTGIYMSLLLEPKKETALELVTAALAVASSRAIKTCLDLDIKIKWVNDLFYKGKKVAGILTEGIFTGSSQADYLVVGIGINLYKPQDGFLQGLDQAGYLLEEKKEGLFNLLIKNIIEEFWPLYDQLEERSFLAEYRERSLLLGKEVQVMDQEPWWGLAQSIDQDCRLLVKDQQGKIHKLYSGEVSVRPGDY